MVANCLPTFSLYLNFVINKNTTLCSVKNLFVAKILFFYFHFCTVAIPVVTSSLVMRLLSYILLRLSLIGMDDLA